MPPVLLARTTEEEKGCAMNDLLAKAKALEAAASPEPWWAHAMTLSGPVNTIAQFFGFNYAQGEADLALAVLWRNTGMGLLRAAVVAEQEEYQPGNSRKCTQQGPGFERDECGKCRFCLRRKALAAVQRALEETT